MFLLSDGAPQTVALAARVAGGVERAFAPMLHVQTLIESNLPLISCIFYYRCGI